jgi:2-iminobutanoate/2-iminopropanoate deaminase
MPPRDRLTKKKEVVMTRKGIPAAGPYSRAVRFGELVFVSGISPKNRDGTSFQGTIEEEVENVLDNISKTLDDAGSSMDKVLKVTVILRDEGDWEKMNAVYKRFFIKDPPARTTFQSSIGRRVEMDAIAYV